MAERSLADVVDSTDDLVARFRASDTSRANVHWSVLQEEYTNWIEEQRAWRETSILMDQSYHLANYYFEGPDALRLNADLGLKAFDGDWADRTPRASQHPIPNPDGYIVGDPILFHLGPEEVVVTGNRGLGQRWLQYHAETGDYDVEVADVYSPYGSAPPIDFRFEIQGPTARAVLAEALDGPVPEISFFEMDELTIAGCDAYVLGHGMASAPGYEIFGPWEHHDRVKELLLEVGESHGLRQLGGKGYKTATATSGWLPPGLPAVYDHEDMAGYRAWLGADSVEANWVLGGSYDGADVADYYLGLEELGYGRLADFDHDFVGREALRSRVDAPERTKVTFVWDGADVVDVIASLFSEGETYKFPALPDLFQQWDHGHFDRVEVDGETVGVSMYAAYDYNERAVLSLGVIEAAHAGPGTEVTVVWGEEGSEKANVERHVEKDVGATVAPAPYVRAREDL